MKQVLRFTTFTLLFATATFTRAKKELSCEECSDNNRPPIANAGADQAITLLKDNVILDGRASLPILMAPSFHTNR